jgi:hypothetical protein
MPTEFVARVRQLDLELLEYQSNYYDHLLGSKISTDASSRAVTEGLPRVFGKLLPLTVEKSLRPEYFRIVTPDLWIMVQTAKIH